MTLIRTASTSAQALAMELGITDPAKKVKIFNHILALLTLERERCAQIIEARLPLYTELGQRNALKECISSIRSAGE